MGFSPEERQAIVKAKLAQMAAKKTKDALPPVVRQPYDPENALLSKDEFIAKQRLKKEEEAEARAHIARKRQEREGAPVSDNTEVEEEEALEAEPQVKRGRPKKVD